MNNQEYLKAARAEANRQASRVFLWCLICMFVGHAAGLLRGRNALGPGEDWLVVILITLVAVGANLIVRRQVMDEYAHRRTQEDEQGDDDD